MNTANLIRKQLEKTGSKMYLQDGEWTSMPFWANVFHLWRKSRTNFEAEFTEIGRSEKDYYFYVGPANHDITALSENAVLIAGDKKFLFKKRDAVAVGEDVIYYTGALLKIQEGDYNEN